MPVLTPPPDDPSVWTFRGYQIEGSSFATALVHLYRAEVSRSSAWRNRLDVTTNWAVVSTGAALSFAFAQPETHHSVIILITALVTLFLLIEARRYRYFELWSYRVRLLETDFFAAMLTPPFRPRANWSDDLARSLKQPQFPISMWEAFGRRLRRNYMWIYLVLGLAWLAKLLLFPVGVNSLDEFIARAHLGAVRGWLVILLHAGFYAIMIAVGIATHRLQRSSGEVLSREAREIEALKADIASGAAPNIDPDA